MQIGKFIGGVIAVSLLSVATVQAQPRERFEPGWHGDMRHFHERDLARWRGGHWFRGNYGGRLGWWWIVGGVYYWYPRPVYPFPDPYIPPVVVQQPPVIVAPAPQPAPAPAPAPSPQASTWYFCEAAKAYYPYVAECPSGWRPVPATPTAPR